MHLTGNMIKSTRVIGREMNKANLPSNDWYHFKIGAGIFWYHAAMVFGCLNVTHFYEFCFCIQVRFFLLLIFLKY